MQKPLQLLRISRFIRSKNRFYSLCIATFLSCTMLQSIAQDLNKKTFNLNLTAMTIKAALMEVQKQSGVKFVYDDAINKYAGIRLTASEKGISVKKAIELILQKTNLRFIQMEDQIVLEEKPGSQRGTAITQPVRRTDRQLRGVVTDSSGIGLPGVSIFIKSSPGSGVISDRNGNFHLQVPDNSVLVINFVGFISQEIPVGKRDFISVRLKEDTKSLNEVVVVAYGTQKKTNVTGALTSISTEEITRAPSASLSNVLAGRLPGLLTIQSSGEPGADDAQLYIRGYGTYNGKSPLILIDGIENNIDRIDANEVESVSVLKDAAATAVYGMKGANGVLLITTKRGKIGKPSVSLTSQLSMQRPTRVPEYLDAFDALTLKKEGLLNDQLNANLYTDEYLNKFRDRSNPTYQYLYPNVDWVDAVLKPYSLMNQNNLNISGGSSSTRYFVSMSYLNQQGLYNNSNLSNYNMQASLNKYNFRSNVDIDITKDLTLEMNLSDVVRDRNYPGATASTLWNMFRVTPSYLYPLTNPDGSVPGLSNAPAHPWGRLTQNGYKRLFENTMSAIVGFNLKLPFVTPGLSVRGRFAFDAQNTRNITRPRSYSTYNYTIDESETDLSKGNYTEINTGDEQLDFALDANSNRKSTVEGYINYGRTFANKHEVTAMVRYNQAQRFNATTQADGGVAALPYKELGVVGRVNYTYDGRYVAEFDAGYNGSENFISGRRMGFFPAGSVAWVISNEPFLKKSRVLNLLKIRASLGTVGVDNSSRRFPYISTWITDGGNGYQFGEAADGNKYSSAEEDVAGNIFLTWEKARKANIGLDLGLFNNALTISGDIFAEHRTNILTSALTIPDLVGIRLLPPVNAGIVDNKGFEVEAAWRKRFGQHGLFLKGNYSYAKNKIISAAEPNYTFSYQARKFTQVYEANGLIAAGLFKDQADIDRSPSQAGYGIIRPGDIKYVDRNGDGIINSQDIGYLGQTLRPKSVFGFNMGYSFKQFELNVLFQGAVGGYNWLTGSSAWAFASNASVLADWKDKHWTPTHQNAEYPRISSTDNPNNNQNSTFWLRSSDYLRLKNVEIAYVLPGKFLNRLGLRGARVFVNGVNLYTWDKFEIFDPEIPDGFGDYPQQKVYNFGFNVTL
jgi:TonB-linked SusC/RagA family outer membrane protein